MARPLIPYWEELVLGLLGFLEFNITGRLSSTELWRRSYDLPRNLFLAVLREKSVEPPVALESYVGAIK